MNNTEKELYNRAQDIVYIIQWGFDNGNLEIEKRQEYYTWEDRSQCIKRYMCLKDQWYASDIRLLVAEPKEVDVKQLLTQI